MERAGVQEFRNVTAKFAPFCVDRCGDFGPIPKTSEKSDFVLNPPTGPVTTILRYLPLAPARSGKACLTNPKPADKDIGGVCLSGGVCDPVHVRRKDGTPFVELFSQQQNWLAIALERQNPHIVTGLRRILGVVEKKSAVARPACHI